MKGRSPKMCFSGDALRPWIINLTSRPDPQKKLAIKEKGTGADMVKKTISKSGRKVVPTAQYSVKHR